MPFFLLVFLFFSSTLTAKQTLCLNMIVKNESAVICRCLDSVKPFIDYWVIVDTGSEDGTQEVIKNALEEIPGELYERPWKNFAENRTEALHLAKGKGDYLLFMDADDWLETDPGFTFPLLDKDAYEINRGTSSFSFAGTHFIKADLEWKWEGVVHEYLVCNSPFSMSKIEGLRYVLGGDGGSYQEGEKYLKHAHLLEEALEADPTNSRYMFYLAQSYKDAGYPFKAIECYKKRTQMQGWEEEVFWSLLQIAHLLKAQDEELAIDFFYRAHRCRPHRPEPVYYLAEIYNQRGQVELAYALLKSWGYIPKPPSPDRLFNETWIQDWGLLFQLSICSYYLKHYEESLTACDELLLNSLLPENYREQVVKNRVFPEQVLQLMKTALRPEVDSQ